MLAVILLTIIYTAFIRLVSPQYRSQFSRDNKLTLSDNNFVAESPVARSEIKCLECKNPSERQVYFILYV